MRTPADPDMTQQQTVHAVRSNYVVPPPEVTAIPVRGTNLQLPVRKIYCVGRNYAAHAVEMGHDPDREAPFFFCKSSDAILHDGGDLPYPSLTNEMHFEIELVVALGRGGQNIPIARAPECVFGYAVGLDMTRRDLQAEAKKLGRPWDAAKSFAHSAPCSPIVPISNVGALVQGAIWLDVNGERRQDGDLNQMIWKVPEVISYLSELFPLSPGDLIFTGTPAGVGPTTVGDRLFGHIDGVGEIRINVVAPQGT